MGEWERPLGQRGMMGVGGPAGGVEMKIDQRGLNYSVDPRTPCASQAYSMTQDDHETKLLMGKG